MSTVFSDRLSVIVAHPRPSQGEPRHAIFLALQPPEHDLRDGVRGKHAVRYAEGTNVVLLDPDPVARPVACRTRGVNIRQHDQLRLSPTRHPPA